MENKKKKVNTKKVTKKVVAATKKTTAKKVAPKTTKKVATPKKAQVKTTKKVEVKKVAPKKVEPKVTPKEEVLEKTYIFNKEEQADLSEVVKEMSNKEVPSYENIGKLDKENKGIILGLTITIALVIIGCLIYVMANINKEDSLEKEFIDNPKYKNIEVVGDDEEETTSKSFKDADYSNITNTNIDDFEVRVAEGQDMLAIISSDTCFYCVTFEPTLNEVLVAKKDKAIRLNITNMTDKETKRLRNYYAFKAAPTLLVIRKGEVVSDYEGAMDKETLEKWYDENVK